MQRKVDEGEGGRQRAIAAALGRDVDAHFEAMVKAYQHRVYGFVLSLIANPHDAEEVAQETFVAAYRALLRYGAEQRRTLALRSWLYTIALNRVRNRQRSRGRTVPLDDAAATLAAPEGNDHDPGASAERAEERAAVGRALAALAWRYRAPLVLRHLEGMSYNEIALVLAQPVGTAKANVHRGLALLRTSVDLGAYR